MGLEAKLRNRNFLGFSTDFWGITNINAKRADSKLDPAVVMGQINSKSFKLNVYQRILPNFLWRGVRIYAPPCIYAILYSL